MKKMNEVGKGSSLTTLALIGMLLVIGLVYFGQTSQANRIGLSLTLYYADGTSRVVSAPSWSDAIPMQMVWDGSKQVNSIESNMILQNSLSASTMTYACVYEVKLDGAIKRTGTVTANVPVTTNKNVALTSVAASEITGWTGNVNGTHELAINVPDGSSLSTVSEGQTKMYSYHGQLVTLSLNVQENVTVVNPPPTASPTPPPIGTASVTVYTKTWNAGNNSWVTQSGVSVTVAGGGWSDIWNTGQFGYHTGTLNPGSYTFTATSGGYPDSESLTVTAGQITSVTLYFGSATPSYLLSDDFEAGNLLKWTGTKTVLGTVPAVSTASFRSGSHSACFKTNPTLNFAESVVYYTLNGLSKVYVRAYVYATQASIDALSTRDRFYFIGVITGSSEYAELGILHGSTPASPTYWYLDYMYTNATGGDAYGYQYSATQLTSVPAWSCLEMVWDKNTGKIQAWLNNQLIIDVSASMSSIDNAAEARVGIIKSGASGGANDPTSQYAIEVYADDVIVDVARPSG